MRTDRPSNQALLALAPAANPVSLAVLRIAVGVGAIKLGVNWLRSDVARLPRELWWPPNGTVWAVDIVPVSTTLFQMAVVLFVGSAGAVVLGYRARLAASVALFAGLYAGWIPHLTGKVDHYHHIVWFLALLALSPCDDSLSIRGSKPPKRPERYGVPILAGVVILGVIYLSSGLPKIHYGLDWALSDNLRNVMWNLWWEKQHTPPLPIDQWPIVYKTMGLFTIAFEILFLPAALYPATRRWVRWIGLLFHVSIWIFLGINFFTLLILYVVLFDWGKEQTPKDSSQRWLPLVVQSCIVAVITFGALALPAGWPLSGYPAFARLAQPEYVDFQLVDRFGGTTSVTRSGLADTYGPHRARPIAAVATVKEQVPLLLSHVAELEGVEDGHYATMRQHLTSTDPKVLAQPRN